MTARKKAPAKLAAVVTPEPTGLQAQLPQVTSMIERAIVNPDVSVEKMERLFALQKEVLTEQAKMDYAAAMARFQASKGIIEYNEQGTGAGGSTYGYADFGKMERTIAPWMAPCGLSFTHRQDPPVMDAAKIAMVMVYCTIRHASGHKEEFSFPAVPDRRTETKWSPSQLLQAAVTYAKRQTLAMGLGLATGADKMDDDAINHAGPLSEERAADLRALMEEVAADGDKFFAFCSKRFKRTITSVNDIPDQCYADAVAALEAKRK